tara:strand:- start:77 stop:517 length:441 start_codon:yes stop_codon:yes gene_type:complete
MQLNSLSPRTKSLKKKRVGRGGTRGKTSGRGHKGQKQHGGHGIRPHMRDEIKRLPKLRGRGVNSNTPVSAKAVAINVATIEEYFKAGQHVTPKSLLALGLIKKRGDLFPVVKVLGMGDISKKVIVVGCKVSESAKTKIEKAGGSVK